MKLYVRLSKFGMLLCVGCGELERYIVFLIIIVITTTAEDEGEDRRDHPPEQHTKIKIKKNITTHNK